MLSVFLTACGACGSSCLFTATWHHICYCCVFFCKKVRFLISKVKKKIYKNIPLELNSTGILLLLQELNSERYIYFLFYFQNLGGSLPASSSASARCTDIKKRDTSPFIFSSGHVEHHPEDYKKKKWNLIPLRRAYEWPKESARTST